MANHGQKTAIADIPSQVCEAFVSALESTDVSKAVVARLRKTLLDDQNSSETAIRTALFSTDQLS